MTVSVTDSPSAIPALMRVRDRRAIFNPQAPGRCPAGRMRGSCLRRSPHASSGSVAGCGQVLLEPDGDPEELTPKIDPPDLNPTPGGTPRMSSRRGASVPAAGHLSRRPPRLRVLKRLGRLDGLLRLNLLAPREEGPRSRATSAGVPGAPGAGGGGRDERLQPQRDRAASVGGAGTRLARGQQPCGVAWVVAVQVTAPVGGISPLSGERVRAGGGRMYVSGAPGRRDPHADHVPGGTGWPG